MMTQKELHDEFWLHVTIKNIAIAAIAAAMSAAAAANDITATRVAAPAAGAGAGTNETGKAKLPTEEITCLAQKVEAWFDARQWPLRKTVGDDGRGVMFYGVMGRFPTFFSQIPFTIYLNDADNEKIVFFAFLPVAVPEGRRDEVSELLLRMSRKFGLSSVDVVFDADDGEIRFQTAFPVVSMRVDPDVVLDGLVIPVAECMAACSESVARLSLGIGTVDEALSGIEKLSFDMLRTKGAKVVEDAEAVEMLKRHLDKTVSHYETVEKDGLTQFKITLQELKGPYERLDSYLAVRDGVVFNQCFLPTNVPPGRVAEMRRYIMRKNLGLCFSLYTLDPVSGCIGCKYTTPIGLLAMSTDDKAVGRECFLALCYATCKINELAQELSKEFKADEESVMIPLEQAEAKVDSIVKARAVGGRPLPPSSEPLPYRYANARSDFVARKLGFSKRERHVFPTLAPVKNASSLKVDLAGRFAEIVKGHVAQFPDGEIRWTEDGTNGLSLVESDVKMREAQMKCVKEAMKGRECANETGTVWILNENFVFGYAIGLNDKRKDDLVFVLITRRALGDAPAGVVVVLEYIPSQLVLDSIVGAFQGDETARANLRLLKEANLITAVTE
jgi:hypothetical protein